MANAAETLSDSDETETLWAAVPQARPTSIRNEASRFVVIDHRRDATGLSAADRNLLAAVEQNDTAAVVHAICNGANVSCVRRCLEGHYNTWHLIDTPLLRACFDGHVDIVRILLDKGANTRWKESSGCTAMSKACNNGYLSIVEMLLNHDHGLLEIADEDGNTPLQLAIDSHQEIEIVQFLLSRGANVDTTDKWGTTILMNACRNGSFVSMRLLLAAGAVVEARDMKQQTALHYAADNGLVDGVYYPPGWRSKDVVVRELIEVHNADMLAVDEDGKTPFDLAGEGIHTLREYAVAICFLQLYGNKMTRDHGRLTLHAILCSAVYSYDDDDDDWHPPLNPLRIILPLGKLASGHLRSLLHYLNTLGTEMIRDDSGNLPIHISCESNAPVEILSLLVEMDPATLHIADSTGSLPIHLLLCNSSTTPTDYDCVRYLVEQGGVGTLAARNHKGALPLHNLVASMNPPLRTVQYLIHSFPGAVAEPMNAGPYPFMVAACEASSASLSVVYELVRANPGLLLPR